MNLNTNTEAAAKTDQTTKAVAAAQELIVPRLNGIRIELDTAIKLVDENLGFEHAAWQHLVAAKDAVGMAALSIPGSIPKLE